MWNKSVDTLSAEELQELIRQRRAGVVCPTPAGRRAKPQTKRQRQRKWWDKLLLLMAILVITGLFFIFGISARGRIALRQQLPMDGIVLVDDVALAAAPLQNTPQASLPPIGWRNLASVNNAVSSETHPPIQPLETPKHLQRWLQPNNTVPAISVPEPTAQPATRIVIPSIDVDAPIGEGTDWESLKYKVGHQPGTANPGQRGNMVLAAHNDVYGELFRYLPDVPVGEIITIYAGDEAFRYQITERRIIVPKQVEVMLPTTGPTTTLISCYPYLIDTHRIVLFGELVG
jgi:sortase A